VEVHDPQPLQYTKTDPITDKSPAYDVETWKHHGYALAEVWVGRDAINTGDLTGSQMYDTMFKSLISSCYKFESGRCDVPGVWYVIDTHYIKNMATGEQAWGMYHEERMWEQ
jgi:hypothetical protein